MLPSSFSSKSLAKLIRNPLLTCLPRLTSRISFIIGFDRTSHQSRKSFGLGCPNRTEPRPNCNKNSEKPKPKAAIFSQNHGLQFFARNSAQKWSKLLNFEKVHNFPLNCYPLSSLLNAQGD